MHTAAGRLPRPLMESARGEPLQDTFGRVLPLALGVGSIDFWELALSKK